MAGGVLIVSGTRKGTFGYRLERAGGAWTARQLWNNTDLPMYMSSPVVDGTLVYGFGSKRKGQLFCLDAQTGAAKWTTEGRGGTNAAIQSAGPNLIVAHDRRRPARRAANARQVRRAQALQGRRVPDLGAPGARAGRRS